MVDKRNTPSYAQWRKQFWNRKLANDEYLKARYGDSHEVPQSRCSPQLAV